MVGVIRRHGLTDREWELLAPLIPRADRWVHGDGAPALCRPGAGRGDGRPVRADRPRGCWAVTATDFDAVAIGAGDAGVHRDCLHRAPGSGGAWLEALHGHRLGIGPGTSPLRRRTWAAGMSGSCPSRSPPLDSSGAAADLLLHRFRPCPGLCKSRPLLPGQLKKVLRRDLLGPELLGEAVGQDRLPARIDTGASGLGEDDDG
jgi:hypothetical protein